MKKIPKYKSVRILLVSGLFYFFLVMPFMGFIFIREIPKLIDHGLFTIKPNGVSMEGLNIKINNHDDTSDTLVQHTSNPDTLLNELTFQNSDSLIDITIDSLKMHEDKVLLSISNDSSNNAPIIKDIIANKKNENNPQYFSTSFNVFYNGILLAFLVGFLFSIPFKRYFRLKRKGKKISTRLEFFCRRYLLYTPVIYATIFGLVIFATIGYIGYVNLFEDLSGNVNANIFDDYFYIASLAGFLSTIFVYYWHKHRVHINYIEVLFGENELRKRIFRKSIGRIRNRLWLASGMTTLLPLTIVIFYLILSVSRASDLDLDLANEQIRRLLLGNYDKIFSSTVDISDLYYVDSINALMMFIGIGTSIFVSLIYILTFVRWTTQDIVFPVKELLENMQKTGDGKNTNFSIVRTNDEIGRLAEGYNIMSQRIRNYIDHINEINTSYYRFVPKQFLDFLDKKQITDIHLGDQVQKEMSVMFSDIRSFTQLSENMTPRDNFNFINHYLGYMEPVISKNKGFIDKYIGDAIMALFAESVDDAIDAAIEMRLKLQEFNEDLKLTGNEEINSGIGINTGNLMLGIVGGKGRIEGTVISDHVNLASRLEGLTKIYGASIIISQDSLIKIKNPSNYQFRFLDTVLVKGKRNSVNIFEILDGETKTIRNQKIASKQKFSQGQELIKNQKINEALIIFQEIKEDSPNDKAIHLYIDRCKSLLSKS